MGLPLRLLLVEDSEDDAALLLRALKNGGYDVVHQRVDTEAAMEAALAKEAWDLVVSDHSMPNFSSHGALAVLKKRGLDIPFILVSGSIGEQSAVAAVKEGVSDYIMKGSLTRLVPAVERELREALARKEKRITEAQLRQIQKMEMVGRLAGGIAHDFNNLLTAISGYSEFLLKSMAPEDPNRADVEEIRTAGKRAAALTRQLLAFSRKQVLQLRLLDVNDVLKELDKMLRRLIGEDIELALDLAADLGTVKADPGQIEQVVVNLVVNARDAMPKGGRISIQTKNVELGPSFVKTHIDVTPGPHAMLAVSDTGTGMDQATLSHLFEPFFTTKERGKGTGLGLSTVYGIVKQSGGSVYVYSELGRGTTFKVYLPIVGESAPPLKARVEAAPRGGSETVLLVEDDELVRNFAVRALRQYGYEVLVAKIPEEALSFCADPPAAIKLLLTDVIMPKMRGTELAERVRAAVPGVKVLFMSGYTDEGVVRDELIAPDAPFLQKPMTPDALARKVRGILDGPAPMT